MARLGELWKDLGKARQRGFVALLIVFVVGLGVGVVGPVARYQLEKRAAARGLSVEVARVRLGRGGLWLLGLRVRSMRARAVQGSLDAVLVPLGDGPVEVHGGRVRLQGSVEAVRAAVARPAGGSGARGSGRALVGDGVELTWTELPAGGAAHVWGIAFRRGGGTSAVGADLAVVSRPGLGARARGVRAEWSEREPGGLRGASAQSVDAWANAEELLGTGARTMAPPRAPGGASQAVPSVASGSAAAPAAPAVGASPANVATWLRTAATQALPEGASAKVEQVRLELGVGGERVSFGPSTVEVVRQAAQVTVVLAPRMGGANHGTALSLRGRLPLPSGDPTLEVEGGPVPLSLLGVQDGELGLMRTHAATLEAHAVLTLSEQVGKISARGSGRLANLSVLRPALAPGEIRGVRLGFRGAGEVSVDGSELSLEDAEVSLGELTLGASLELSRGPGRLHLRSKGGVPLASCETMLSALPAALTAELGGMALEGTFSLHYDVDVDTTDLEAMKVRLDVKNDCRIVKIPAGLSPDRFRHVWSRDVKGPDGSPVTIESGPATPGWVPYHDIPKSMETAVLVCEDGGFFRHGGFDYRAIEKAIKEDVRAGRFVRGASTISMQLAKNLYLGPEKTLARKIQEAFFTMLLEQQLTKEELMALYLNVVELGPGVYGIGAAADHYFATDARDLTLGQSLYLASILPDPTRQHFEPDGRVSERWSRYLKKLMGIARRIERITDEELEAGLEEQVAFRQPGPGLGAPGPDEGGEAEPFEPEGEL